MLNTPLDDVLGMHKPVFSTSTQWGDSECMAARKSSRRPLLALFTLIFYFSIVCHKRGISQIGDGLFRGDEKPGKSIPDL